MSLLSLNNLNKKSLSISILGIIIALVFFGILSNFIYKEKKIYRGECLTNNCTITINGKIYESVSNSSITNSKDFKKGDTICISKILDNYNIINPVICFENSNNVVKVLCNGELLYSYGNYSYKAKINGNNIVKVSLGNNYVGKKIEIELILCDKSSSTLIPNINIMSINGANNYFIADNLFHFIIGLSLLFLGIMFLSFILYSYGLNKQYRKIICLSFESISIALWILSCFNIIEIYFTNYIINYFIEYESIYLCIIFLLLYIYNLISDTSLKKIVIYIFYIVTFVSLILNILQFIQLKYLSETLTFFIILGLLGTLISVILYIYDTKNNGNNIYLTIVELLIIGITLSAYYLFRILHVIHAVYALNYIPVIIFVLILVNYVNFIDELLRDFMSKKEKQSLMDMAYLDSLTGISNRRGFDRYVKNIAQSLNNYIIFSFDINNLKNVNDTYGHLAGDDLIKTFVKALKLIDNIDFCSRMGGDEFNVFIKGSSSTVAEKFQRELALIVDMLNNENSKEYQLSYACGYSFYISDENPDIQNIISEADCKMYEDKVRGKGMQLSIT